MSKARPFPPMVWVVVALLRPLFTVATKRDRRGIAKLPPAGGYVIAANHLSYIDPFLLGFWATDQGVPPRFLFKDSLLEVPIVGWVLRKARQIPVHRGTDSASDSLRDAIAAVDAGQVVIVYPEGTMTRDPACWPMTGRTGAVRIAHETGKPLFPVAQWGAQDIIWPYKKGFHPFPRKTIHIWVGDPIDLTDLGANPTEDQLLAKTAVLMAAITELQAQIRGELPATPPIDVHTLDTPNTNLEEN
ncbi:MAG TPA: lysophospholipid acyltransferase family protein [Aeromicrobium sp.]|nr:lysophospholipid acyltransferase family protein [Aeromicrobium sp.]